MQRLGKNHGGYHGERIDIHHVCRGAVHAARQHGWQVETIPFDGGGELLTFQRHTPGARRNVYISSGIHGDEPAGPLAMQRLLVENLWPADTNLLLCPCLNPTGFPLNRRENLQGKDLNRDYKHFETAEARAHIGWLQSLPGFDLALCLHEDWEANGFYLYELNPDAAPSLAQRMVDAVARECPIDLAEVIEGRPACGGVIHPSHDPESRPQWPEAFWLLQHKTRLSYTLEAASDFPLTARVNALVAAVRAGLCSSASE
ncbi:MAG: M14 family metallocarboxypeptidase [Verrucomicrobia bacterium]|nr:M14 family metallocarboxypeptidase [Verrucomicrobiota bacterium]